MEERAEGLDRLADALGRPRPKQRHLTVVHPDHAPSVESERNAVWRPTNLDEMVGQEHAQLLLAQHVAASMKRGEQPGHVLLSGPPGLGKTSMGAMLAALVNQHHAEGEHVGLHTVMGSACKNEKALLKVLAKLTKGDVLFVDECHRMGTPAEEMLGLAMEDGRVSVEGQSEPLDIPPFTLVGATTRPANLSRPLRDRFKLALRMRYYDAEELAEIVRRAAERAELAITEGACLAIACVGRETPRVTLGVFEKVRNHAGLLDLDKVDGEAVRETLSNHGIDSIGLDGRDREYMVAVAKGGGERVGLSTLGAMTGLDSQEIEKDVEPDLIRMGLVTKAARGRVLTKLAYKHLWPDKPVPPLLGLS